MEIDESCSSSEPELEAELLELLALLPVILLASLALFSSLCKTAAVRQVRHCPYKRMHKTWAPVAPLWHLCSLHKPCEHAWPECVYASWTDHLTGKQWDGPELPELDFCE